MRITYCYIVQSILHDKFNNLITNIFFHLLYNMYTISVLRKANQVGFIL